MQRCDLMCRVAEVCESFEHVLERRLAGDGDPGLALSGVDVTAVTHLRQDRSSSSMRSAANNRELAVFSATLRPSIALVRTLRGALPALLGNAVSRTALLAQLSARPWALSPETVLPDVRGLADAPATGAAMDALTKGPKQGGAPAGTVPGRVTIGWGRRDLVTVPSQARRAIEAFPDAALHWFSRCGHFPQWDAPQEAIRLILNSTG